MRSSVARWLRGLLASALMVAGVSGLLMLVNPHVPALHLRVLYVLVVLSVAIVWGTGLAALAAVMSAAAYSYLFIPPTYSFHVADWRSIVALGVFLAVAVVVGNLAARLRRAALEAARLSQEQSALRRVATLVARSAPPSMVFDAVTREVGQLCGADLARMERYEADGTVTGVAAWSTVPAHLAVGTRFALDGLSVARDVRRTGGPVRLESFAGAAGGIADEARALGIRSSVGCPIVVSGRLWGVIAASTKSDQPFPPNTEAQIASFTELVAAAVENAEARAELTSSRARIVATADQTRRRIERDLHDGAQQRLVSLVLRLRAAQAAVPPELDELSAELDGVAAGLSDALDELREMARGIHPAILAEGGLAPALKALARRSLIPVDLVMHVESGLPESVEISAYYVVSEALTNVAKHADASAVTVTVEAADAVLRVTVHDDGVGGADVTGGTGLVGLKDRVEALGGRIFLESPHGAGTTLRAEFPLTDADGVRPANAWPGPSISSG
jgi:signal transduction histidine kinase